MSLRERTYQGMMDAIKALVDATGVDPARIGITYLDRRQTIAEIVTQPNPPTWAIDAVVKLQPGARKIKIEWPNASTNLENPRR